MRSSSLYSAASSLVLPVISVRSAVVLHLFLVLAPDYLPPKQALMLLPPPKELAGYH